jgi:phage terminase large subunit-like protein
LGAGRAWGGGARGGTEAFVVRTATLDEVHRTQCFWQDPGGGGKADCAAKVAAVSKSGRRAIFEVAGSSKLSFANVWAPVVERGELYLLDTNETETILGELEAFPSGVHDDIPDAISLAFQCWSKVPAVDDVGAVAVTANRPSLLGVPATHGRRGPW